jgi:hypothetical protein
MRLFATVLFLSIRLDEDLGGLVGFPRLHRVVGCVARCFRRSLGRHRLQHQAR